MLIGLQMHMSPGSRVMKKPQVHSYCLHKCWLLRVRVEKTPSAGYVWEVSGGIFSKLRTMSFPDRQKTAVATARAAMPTQPPCFIAKGMDSSPMPMNMFT